MAEVRTGARRSRRRGAGRGRPADSRRHPGRPGGARRPRPGPRRRGHHRARSGDPHERRTDRLPLPLHRGRGARRLRLCSPTWPPSARAKMAESRQPAGRHPRAAAPTSSRAGAGDGGPLSPRGRLFAFGNGGSATDAEGTVGSSRTRRPAGPCRRCRWSTTGPSSPPWPTTSASNWSSPARSSPTPAPATSRSVSPPVATRST